MNRFFRCSVTKAKDYSLLISLTLFHCFQSCMLPQMKKWKARARFGSRLYILHDDDCDYMTNWTNWSVKKGQGTPARIRKQKIVSKVLRSDCDQGRKESKKDARTHQLHPLHPTDRVLYCCHTVSLYHYSNVNASRQLQGEFRK